LAVLFHASAEKERPRKNGSGSLEDWQSIAAGLIRSIEREERGCPRKLSPRKSHAGRKGTIRKEFRAGPVK